MILITGGGGFIGLNTARALVDKGQEVVLVDVRQEGAFEVPSFLSPYMDKQVKLVFGNILELPFLYGVIREYNVDSIIHLAAIREGSGSLYQVVKVNVEGTTEVLEAARIFGLRCVTFCSSSGVYLVIKDRQALREDRDLPVESSSYISATKKAGEEICQLYAKEYGFSVRTVRPAVVWGPMYSGRGIPIRIILENPVVGKPADLTHICGVNKRYFVYVRDLARAISLVHLAPSLKYDIYNVSDGELHTYADFAEAVREAIPGARIRLGTTRRREDVDQPLLSIERIKEDLGFTPDYDLRRGIRDYIDWLRNGKYG